MWYAELNNNSGTYTRKLQRYIYVVIQQVIKIVMVNQNQYFSFSSGLGLATQELLHAAVHTLHTVYILHMHDHHRLSQKIVHFQREIKVIKSQ